MNRKVRKLVGYSKPRRKPISVGSFPVYVLCSLFLGFVGNVRCSYETCSEATLETEKENVSCTYKCLEPHERVLLCKKDAERPTPMVCKTSNDNDCPTSRCELVNCGYDCVDVNTNNTIKKDYTGLLLCVQLDQKIYTRREEIRPWTRPKERPDCIEYYTCENDSQTSVILTGAIVGGILVLIILCLVGKQKYNRRGAHCAIPPSALLDENALTPRRDLEVRLEFMEPSTPSPIPSPSMDAPPHYNSVVNEEGESLPPTYDEAVKLKEQLLELEMDIGLIVEEEIPEPKPSDKLI